MMMMTMKKVAAVRSSLDRETGLILTGPTCTGKSTILKQVRIHHCFCFSFCCYQYYCCCHRYHPQNDLPLPPSHQAAALGPETEIRVINPKALQARPPFGLILMLKILD